jgi:hypothetical protein
MSNFDPREVEELLAVEAPRKLHELLILDPERHTQLFFDPSDLAQVKAAEKVYAAAMQKNFQAFGENGIKGATFDPTEVQTIVTPAIRGG